MPKKYTSSHNKPMSRSERKNMMKQNPSALSAVKRKKKKRVK